MGFYDKHILPRIIDWGCGQEEMKELRQLVTPLARGRVLEVGIGSGRNLPFYDPAKVEHATGIDPSQELLALARERSRGLPFPVDLRAVHDPQRRTGIDAYAPSVEARRQSDFLRARSLAGRQHTALAEPAQPIMEALFWRMQSQS